MKSRDEAKKMAEELAELDNSIDTSEERAFELGFMACYDAMTEGAPECWVVGHETKGYNGASLNFHSAHTARMMHVDEEYGGDSYDCDELDESWKKAEEDGWFVVPVKLIKVEESSK